MFGKARDLPRGRSARLVRHDRVRRLLSLGGRSSGRLSEDLVNPPLGLRSSPPDLHPRQRARTAPHTTVAERAVGHRVARGVHHPPGQVDSSGLLPERSSGRTWAPCPGPPRREGGRTLTSPAVPASASRKALSTAYPSGRGADGSSQGADAGGHHPRPHRTRRPAQSGAARACWAPQAPLAAAFKHRIHGFCFSLARRGAHFRTPGLIEGGRGSFRTRDGVQ
jgi:hypothetical protein